MTYPAPKYLEDDPWFGPGCFSLYQIDYKLAYEQAVIENLLLDDTNIEVKNIHEVIQKWNDLHIAGNVNAVRVSTLATFGDVMALSIALG